MDKEDLVRLSLLYEMLEELDNRAFDRDGRFVKFGPTHVRFRVHK